MYPTIKVGNQEVRYVPERDEVVGTPSVTRAHFLGCKLSKEGKAVVDAVVSRFGEYLDELQVIMGTKEDVSFVVFVRDGVFVTQFFDAMINELDVSLKLLGGEAFGVSRAEPRDYVTGDVC